MASLKPKYIQMAKTGTDRKLIYEDFCVPIFQSHWSNRLDNGI